MRNHSIRQFGRTMNGHASHVLQFIGMRPLVFRTSVDHPVYLSARPIRDTFNALDEPIPQRANHLEIRRVRRERVNERCLETDDFQFGLLGKFRPLRDVDRPSRKP